MVQVYIAKEITLLYNVRDIRGTHSSMIKEEDNEKRDSRSTGLWRAV